MINLSLVIIIVISINLTNCLECYVCDNQEENAEKCLNTIKTCEQGEDYCLSEISWGSTPYWTFGAAKQYYVSKRCSTMEKCIRYRSSVMPLCTHIWYQDWKCSECCRGDRCNYYIFSGSKRTTATLSLVSSIMLLFILYA
ncbi:hypothetical protein RN001_011463 [Aquatica leii]|uniref:Uncharacterized protein n=1 Tax=Aquatica leii TaxID=1421715 RepID=A0AAN7S7F7_9COLE|nr:hypothetical protein RN001_011463 [Aquatica leii]